MAEWGEWITNRVPELGDYIQVDSYLLPSLEKKLLEGTVVEIDGDYIRLHYMQKGQTDNWVATRWRKLKPREFTGKLRVRELEDV